METRNSCPNNWYYGPNNNELTGAIRSPVDLTPEDSRYCVTTDTYGRRPVYSTGVCVCVCLPVRRWGCHHPPPCGVDHLRSINKRLQSSTALNSQFQQTHLNFSLSEREERRTKTTVSLMLYLYNKLKTESVTQ